jgi:tRNA (cmo5U34)-methyltransferase
LEDPLPDGPYDVVVSALAVHHLAAASKADLFRRIAGVISRTVGSSSRMSSSP